MQLEAIRAVSMSHLPLESLRQIDNLDGIKRTSLDAHAATMTEMFRDETDGRGWLHINA